MGLKTNTQYFLQWTRTGDDGKTASGKEKISWNLPVRVETQLAKPGFVRIRANIVDAKGNVLRPANKHIARNLAFDGGTGVEMDKLTQATPRAGGF